MEGLYLFLVNETVSEYWAKLGGMFDDRWYLAVTLETARDRYAIDGFDGYCLLLEW